MARCSKWFLLLLCALCVSARCQSKANPNSKNYEATSKSVVFIYVRDAQGQEKPDGTAFLLQVPTKKDPNRGYVLLVTARHMVDSAWMGCPASKVHLVARFNKKEFNPTEGLSGTTDYDLGDQSWIVPDDPAIDIAYTLLNGHKFEELRADNAPLTLRVLATANQMTLVGIGDDVFSAGLLEHASGIRRNYPIFKFGNISSILQEKIPIDGGCGGPPRLLTEWLIAASLVPGNSGSPIVFNPLPNHQGERPFILGVQSISFGVQFSTFMGTPDVAGMAPIRPLLESIRHLGLEDADLSQPEESTTPPLATPTSVATPFPAQPGPLVNPK